MSLNFLVINVFVVKNGVKSIFCIICDQSIFINAFSNLESLYSLVYSLIDVLTIANHSEMESHLNTCNRVAEEKI